jgi:lysophospholipase L1-like esterase/pimeloyl-ACP methyl ester carboxylesterase
VSLPWIGLWRRLTNGKTRGKTGLPIEFAGKSVKIVARPRWIASLLESPKPTAKTNCQTTAAPHLPVEDEPMFSGKFRPLVSTTVIMAAFALINSLVEADDFAIRDGDTVAFLGDSITAARTYGKLIENYTLLRYPDRKVQFINLGKGGETAAGGLARLEKDVFGRGVTLLTVAYGINDIGWGFHADDEHRQRYLNSIRDIVRQCRARSIRVVVCSAAITGADPDKTENDFLQIMCDDGLKLARENGGQTIDVQRTMREIQRRVLKANGAVTDVSKHESLHTADNVHLSDLGQTAMAYAILKGFAAPAQVSSVTIEGGERKLLEASGCQITDLTGTPERLEFTRLDDGLPLNAQTFFALHFRFIPIPEELNQYQLQIKSLAKADYELTVEGRKVGTYSAQQLEQGVNLSSATADPWVPGGPWDAQANILHSLTEARDKLDLSARLTAEYLSQSAAAAPYLAEVTRSNLQLEAMQRQIAKPRPYRFVLQKVDDPKAPQAPVKAPAKMSDAERAVRMVPTQIAGTYRGGELQELRVHDRIAYVVKPTGKVDPAKRWLWEFPFWLGVNDGFGSLQHRHYLEQALAAGFHVAGIDVGPSCGSPAAAAVCQAFHERVTDEFGLNRRARIMGQSHGGLIAYGWAFRNPTCVERIAGICPATDFRSWPTLPNVINFPVKGLDYKLTLPELTDRITEFNPVDNLAPLAKAGVKILHIHGDKDEVVPMNANSTEIARRYQQSGGTAKIVVIEGLGHGGQELYQSEPLLQFLLSD